MNKNTLAYKIGLSSILAALAMIFSYIEAIMPLSIGVPGIKLGIANLVIIIALYKLDGRYAFAINLLRIIVAGLLFSGIFGMFYSMAGGILSLLTMILLKKTNLFSVVGISLAGGVMHNLGQVILASLLVSNIKVFIYFPVLIFSGIATGILIGIVAMIILQKLK